MATPSDGYLWFPAFESVRRGVIVLKYHPASLVQWYVFQPWKQSWLKVVIIGCRTYFDSFRHSNGVNKLISNYFRSIQPCWQRKGSDAFGFFQHNSFPIRPESLLFHQWISPSLCLSSCAFAPISTAITRVGRHRRLLCMRDAFPHDAQQLPSRWCWHFW